MNRKPNKQIVITVSLVLAVALCGLLLVPSNPVSAQRVLTDKVATTHPDASDERTLPLPFEQGTALTSIVKMLSALIIVVILVYVALFLLKRVMSGRRSATNGSGLLEVLQSVYVGPKKTLSLVKVADKTVLIGVTEQQITLLGELDADETAAALAIESCPAPLSGFGDTLRNVLGRFRQSSPATKTSTQGT